MTIISPFFSLLRKLILNIIPLQICLIGTFQLQICLITITFISIDIFYK